MDLLHSIEGSERSAVAPILAVHGECLSKLGQHRAALAEIERALALQAADAPPVDVAGVKEALGRALIAAGRDRGRAGELLRDARDRYVAAGAGHEEEIQRVEQLLRTVVARP